MSQSKFSAQVEEPQAQLNTEMTKYNFAIEGDEPIQTVEAISLKISKPKKEISDLRYRELKYQEEKLINHKNTLTGKSYL
jgi:hypothetical protein